MTVVPPIKSQGIKTKLVHWINRNVSEIDFDRWVEPFMGTCVVAFNIRPNTALMCDSNPHLINFYRSIQNRTITSQIVREFLTEEGAILLESNGEHYYNVRNRFNENGSPLDFLFLSRACFNGMMRFNKGGGYNVPFCKKPNRFAKALITKITNQVESVSQIIHDADYTFENFDFRTTLNNLNERDLVYCDPPYIGRHVDYFDSWTEEEEIDLKTGIDNANSNYILSTWLSNKYRVNEYVFSLWRDGYVATKEHFYHVGGKESNRNAVNEALVSNIRLLDALPNVEMERHINNLRLEIEAVQN